MKNILLTLVVLAMMLIGCTNNKIIQQPDNTQPVTAPLNDSSESDRQTISFADPCFYGGSTILDYFFELLRVSDYSSAVDKLTSRTSIAKYGRPKILDFYKSINVDYSPVLLSIVRHGKDSATLRYRVQVMATSRYVNVNTMVENDTARILLPMVCEYFRCKVTKFSKFRMTLLADNQRK